MDVDPPRPADTAGREAIRSGWSALCVSSLARMVLVVLAGLVLWSVVPAAFGLYPTVVMSGSMLPRLVPGDVVFSRPVPSSQLQLGETLLFVDPDRPGRLRMHRWVAVDGRGLLVTRGDANPAPDSTPVRRSDVRGVATLRVLFIARPIVWAREGRDGRVLLAGGGLLVVIGASWWFRWHDEGETDDEAEVEDDDDRTHDGGAHDTGDDPPTVARRSTRRLVQAGRRC